jgi:hypothetical protein
LPQRADTDENTHNSFSGSLAVAASKACKPLHLGIEHVAELRIGLLGDAFVGEHTGRVHDTTDRTPVGPHLGQCSSERDLILDRDRAITRCATSRLQCSQRLPDLALRQHRVHARQQGRGRQLFARRERCREQRALQAGLVSDAAARRRLVLQHGAPEQHESRLNAPGPGLQTRCSDAAGTPGHDDDITVVDHRCHGIGLTRDTAQGEAATIGRQRDLDFTAAGDQFVGDHLRNVLWRAPLLLHVDRLHACLRPFERSRLDQRRHSGQPLATIRPGVDSECAAAVLHRDQEPGA